ncbi:GH92 family glycosyl hydrolase [Pedobacter miscanthi]|uniref:Glycoside hydrolase family 92 protein n=1 Tax=Pedobacter miscanthi TaxID=2259170 RepID=A0A366L1Y9_9SPHI|nr:glycoside hydrolase family 92 protein [Pedobacter miscanthi]
MVVAILLLTGNTVAAQRLTSFVDPFIGSGSHGHVFVGASVPFGGVQLGPDNFYKGWDWCSGYNYQDSVIRGFAHTHLSGTGIGDLSDILIMPYTGAIKTDKGQETLPGSGYASLFSHKDEQAKPGYYSVKLANGVNVQLAATERVGFHQYHFPAGKEGRVIIDLKEGINDRSTETYIEQVDDFTFKGYRASSGWAKTQLIYFAIKSSIAIKDFSVYNGDKLIQGKSGKDKAIKGLISFERAPGLLQLKIGISPVSAENALANITAEVPDWNFDHVVKAAEDKWEKELAKLNVETHNIAEKKIFYTALYHTMINPSLFDDHNGDYRGTDKKVYKSIAFANYSVFSTWDTYRAAHPLFILTQPERVSDMINSMLAINDQQGKLPIWHLMGFETGTMVGMSSRQIVTEAYLKGIKGFDAERAFRALKTSSMIDTLGLQYVKDFKPIPTDKESRAVAKGLEYAIGDGSIALMAKKMGKTEDYNYFKKRSENYKLYFDPSDGFLKGKRSDGSWAPDFDPLKSKNNLYAEGNAWQYIWLAPQDIPGLIKLLGGEKEFNHRLDKFFSLPYQEEGALADMTGLIGQYAHGNEPGHHIPYLYNYTGEQWKTAEKIRHIVKDMYHDRPDGIIGNEDCGQMSAWYVFSSLGFYPVFPSSGIYAIGSPIFDKATIHLESGKKFIVETLNNSAKNIYVQGISLNGKKYENSYITHKDIVNGGRMIFTMGDKPNYNFGKPTSNRPVQ